MVAKTDFFVGQKLFITLFSLPIYKDSILYSLYLVMVTITKLDTDFYGNQYIHLKRTDSNLCFISSSFLADFICDEPPILLNRTRLELIEEE